MEKLQSGLNMLAIGQSVCDQTNATKLSTSNGGIKGVNGKQCRHRDVRFLELLKVALNQQKFSRARLQERLHQTVRSPIDEVHIHHGFHASPGDDICSHAILEFFFNQPVLRSPRSVLVDFFVFHS